MSDQQLCVVTYHNTASLKEKEVALVDAENRNLKMTQLWKQTSHMSKCVHKTRCTIICALNNVQNSH